MAQKAATPPAPKSFRTKNRSSRSDFFKPSKAVLRLADGVIFEGRMAQGYHGSFSGEVVFTTGMTGYDLSLTDPSYAGQILVFTYPLIGNYGVSPATDWESERIHAAGVVVSEACAQWSHGRAISSLAEWLRQQKVPLLTDVDTRTITKHIRSHGAINGIIERSVSRQKVPAVTIPRISIEVPRVYNPTGEKTIVLVDCGMKQNILRTLQAAGYRIKRVPWDYDYSKDDFDGVFLSNGPGDPADYQTAVQILKGVLQKNKPIFGICLGSQLLALAAGAKTYKLPFGHRSHNQPCRDVAEGRAYITSQNHGYAIDAASLPRGWRVNYRNLNDNSVEGIEHISRPWFAVQFHPEAHPGPVDTSFLFERFFTSL
jgi:carbamoyl-phosphate synthase small subunit